MVPSGSLISCNKLLIDAFLYTSLNSGLSIAGSVWQTKTSFLFDDMATFNASMDLGRPTNKVVTIPGKTTTSLKGITGRSDFISFIYPI